MGGVLQDVAAMQMQPLQVTGTGNQSDTMDDHRSGQCYQKFVGDIVSCCDSSQTSNDELHLHNSGFISFFL